MRSLKRWRHVRGGAGRVVPSLNRSRFNSAIMSAFRRSMCAATKSNESLTSGILA